MGGKGTGGKASAVGTWGRLMETRKEGKRRGEGRGHAPLIQNPQEEQVGLATTAKIRGRSLFGLQQTSMTSTYRHQTSDILTYEPAGGQHGPQ